MSFALQIASKLLVSAKPKDFETLKLTLLYLDNLIAQIFNSASLRPNISAPNYGGNVPYVCDFVFFSIHVRVLSQRCATPCYDNKIFTCTVYQHFVRDHQCIEFGFKKIT